MSLEDLHGELLSYLRGQHGLWTHLRAWNPEEGPLGGWLKRVVLNLCRGLLRREQNLQSRQIPLGQPMVSAKEEEIPWQGPKDPNPNPEESLIENEEERSRKRMEQCLRSSLPRLAPRDQHILYFSYWQQLKDGEIGKELGLSREHVNRLKQAAHQKLQAYVNDCLNSL